MLITINGQVPEWAKQLDEKAKPKNISEWWNNLEWQDYRLPTYSYAECNDPTSMFNEGICYLDKLSYGALDDIKLGFLYKMFANAGSQVRVGIDKEIANIHSLVESWGLTGALHTIIFNLGGLS